MSSTNGDKPAFHFDRGRPRCALAAGGFCMQTHRTVPHFCPADGDAGFDLDSRFFQFAVQQLADFFVNRRQGQQTVLPFNHSDLCAKRLENAGHFTAYHAAAHNADA